ncbi:MAG: hypothetical protein AAF138_04500 [Planctomycetota bacterium]
MTEPSATTKAACLGATLATAWTAAPAAAQTDLEVPFEVSPEIDITDSVLVYSEGFSSRDATRVGAISAGETRALPTTFSLNEQFDVGYYLFVGTYDDNGSPGLVVSFADADAPTALGAEFASLFADPGDGRTDVIESEVIQNFIDGIADTNSARNRVNVLFGQYFDDRGQGRRFALDTNTNGTLVSFSTGAFAGVIAVPAPGAAILGGVVLLGGFARRRR